MKRVAVIGGGFAGTSVVRALSNQPKLEVLLIDQKENFEFLPMLPEVLGRRMAASDVAVSLEEYCARHGASFTRRPRLKAVLTEGMGI